MEKVMLKNMFCPLIKKGTPKMLVEQCIVGVPFTFQKKNNTYFIRFQVSFILSIS